MVIVNSGVEVAHGHWGELTCNKLTGVAWFMIGDMSAIYGRGIGTTKR
jgi:hypothetical protein